MFAKEARRVKYFQMDPNGDWDDRGVGYVTVDTSSEPPAIVVKSESDENITLLRVKISTGETYLRQADSVIVWQTEDEAWSNNNNSMAISFQEKYSCTITLNEINEAQKTLRDQASFNNFLDSVLVGPNENVNKQQTSSNRKVHKQQETEERSLSKSYPPHNIQGGDKSDEVLCVHSSILFRKNFKSRFKEFK